jgi:hypothetical protein
MSEVPGQGPGQSHSFDELARSLASGSLSRRRALKIFAAAAVAALVPSRALAAPGPCPPNARNKTTICHKPKGRDYITLCVNDSAVPAHVPGHNGPPGAGPDFIVDEQNPDCPPVSPPPPPPPNGPPPPPNGCTHRGERCVEDAECCGRLKCKGLPGHKRCRRRDDECRERGERCGGDRDCCGRLKCKGLPGHKRCRRIRRDPEDPR